MKHTAIHIESLVTHKTVDIDGFTMHYYVSGEQNSDVILFLHPAFSDHRAFDQQIDFFSQKYQVITIDLIGHGLSKANRSKDKIDASAKHIAKIMEIEGFDKVHIVGVSMGSLIAQYFALNYPDKVHSLTALGGYNINKDDGEVAKAQRSSNFSLLCRALFSMDAFRKKCAEITCYTPEGQFLFYNSARLYTRKSFMVMQSLQQIITNRDEAIAKYPLFILTGEYDIDLAKKMAKEWHSTNTNSTFTMIKDAGHCANIDNPQEFNHIVDAFIEKVEVKGVQEKPYLSHLSQ